GVVAIKAVYKPDGGIESESEPLMLAFGCNAELTWENAAPQRAADDPRKDDEVILQRPAAPGLYDTPYFQEEHALVTLKLNSLLDNNPLAKIPVTWQLMGDQPQNMAVFLRKNTDDEGSNWDAAEQELGSLTDKNGQIEVPVSARQLYKMDDKDQENWRPYTPAVGKAVVVADIQGQYKQIEVPFIDSLWQLAEASKDDKWVPRLYVLGYVGIDGENKASRKLVTGQMTFPWSTEGRHLRLSARSGEDGSSFHFLLPQRKGYQDLLHPVWFPCEDICRKTFEKCIGPMCIEQVRPEGDNPDGQSVSFDFDGLSEDAQESRKNITIKFVSEKSPEECESCSLPFPEQPATEEKVADGAFCLNKPIAKVEVYPTPTLKLLSDHPDTQGPKGEYEVTVSLENSGDTLRHPSEFGNLTVTATQDVEWPNDKPPEKTAVDISRLHVNSLNNTATYRVKGLDDKVGAVAIKAVYAPTENTEKVSEPLLLAFGCNAKLTWKNAAPIYTDKDGTQYTHEDSDEVILQRHADSVISDTSLFMGEHAQVTLKLTSLLNDNLSLAGIPVTWELPDNQPLNMAVFLEPQTDNEGLEWAAANQRKEGQTDGEGENEIEVSARQLHKVVKDSPEHRLVTGKRQDWWRSFTPAAGEVTVVANIQGQREHIEVPFIDSLWLLMGQRYFGKIVLDKYAEGYVYPRGYVRPGKFPAERPFVGAFLDDSTEVDTLRFSAEAIENNKTYDVLLTRRSGSYKYPAFWCQDSDSCYEMYQALKPKPYKGQVCFRYQACPTAASVKFPPDEYESCDPSVCSPLTPPQPPSADEPIEDGIFCVPQWGYNKETIKCSSPEFRLLDQNPNTQGPRGSYKVQVTLPSDTDDLP
ncbi:MAG: hypothetical protein OXC07_08965, partial [Kistimonas sp.]|nr:hypothetical protein [Kistimonas sp.]